MKIWTLFSFNFILQSHPWCSINVLLCLCNPVMIGTTTDAPVTKNKWKFASWTCTTFKDCRRITISKLIAHFTEDEIRVQFMNVTKKHDLSSGIFFNHKLMATKLWDCKGVLLVERGNSERLSLHKNISEFLKDWEMQLKTNGEANCCQVFSFYLARCIRNMRHNNCFIRIVFFPSFISYL